MNIRIVKRVFDRMTVSELSILGRTHIDIKGLDSIDASIVGMDREDIAGFRATLVRLKDEGTRFLQPFIDDTIVKPDTIDFAMEFLPNANGE